MATFEYNALTEAGRLMKGTIEAANTSQANQLLEDMQLVVNSVEKAKEKKPVTAIGRNEFMLFNQQLASITKAGIPIERALRELAVDVSSRSMQKLITSIADELEDGVGIEEAFEKRQKNFPPLYGRILKAGIETGRLSEMLTSLNRHLEMANQTRRIVFEAVSYPAIILVMTAVIMTGMFLLVIPQFQKILGEMTGGELPALTRSLFVISDHVVPFWVGTGILVAGIVVISMMLSASAAGMRFKESILLKIPVFGRVHHTSSMAKMSEAMAMMVASGVDMPTCLRLAASTTGSEKIMLESEILAGQIEQGTGILEAGQFCRMIPRLFLYSIQLGTQRNELQDNLYSLGQMYSEQVRCHQSALQAIMLPVMLVVLGGTVGVTVLAIFLPMVKVITSLM